MSLNVESATLDVAPQAETAAGESNPPSHESSTSAEPSAAPASAPAIPDDFPADLRTDDGALDFAKIAELASRPEPVEAPESYEFTIPEGSKWANGEDVTLEGNDDPLLNEFSDIARETGLSQEAYNKLGGLYVKAMQAIDAAYAARVQEARQAHVAEMAQLAPENLRSDPDKAMAAVDARIKGIENKLIAQFGQEKGAAFGATINTAAGVQMAEAFLELAGSKPEPAPSPSAGGAADTSELRGADLIGAYFKKQAEGAKS